MSDWWASRLGGSRPTSYTAPPAQPGQWVPPNNQAATGLVPTAPAPRVTVENLLGAVASWRGGEGALNSARCPSCGGDVFRRRVGAIEAAPLCYTCGWNGLFTQVQPRGQ